MRVRFGRFLIRTTIFAIIVGATALYVYLNVQDYAYYTDKPWHPVTKCRNSKQELDQLLNLTFQVHETLDSLGIGHWLMYGSIWGARRIQAPLPWDNDVDLGFRGEGNFSRYTLQQVIASFEAKGLIVNNKWFQSRTLTVSKEGWPLTVDLFAFYNNSGWMQRRGLESWVAWINYRTRHTFPSWVVDFPLPKARFGFFEVYIPRGGIEIMKHLYRDSWWKEVKPKVCEEEEKKEEKKVFTSKLPIIL